MVKLLFAAALGAALALTGAAPTASARTKKLKIKHNGVKMKCKAKTHTCKLKNKTHSSRSCKWKVVYVVKQYRFRRRKSSSGRVNLRPKAKWITPFYRGSGRVKSLILVTLFCT